MAAKHYTISFDANGGVGVPDPVDKVENIFTMLPTTKPIRTGYEFIGWGLTNDARVARYNPGTAIELNEDTTLYALWKRDVTLSYDANGGVNAPKSQTETIYNNSPAPYFGIASTKPVREGYTFKGWAATKDATVVSYKPIYTYQLAEDTTLYAVWEKVPDPVDPPAGPVDPADPVDPIDPVDPVIPVVKTACSIKAGALTIPIDSKGAYLNLTVNSDGKRSFKSSSTSVATVDAAGKIVPKKIGSTKITITVAESELFLNGSETVTVTVGPKKVTISKVSSPKKAYLKVTWKKNTTATGYQISYSTDKTFAKGTKTSSVTKQKTVSKSIKVSSKKTYYVRIRSYKTVSGKKYYGPWSSVKSVKTK
ncbi:MAG: InlB B-repeat-containing protein [Lachnospiraceae bacterium]|nr:InlB B-repeat-containing protein [Lachnospiraceae bacterium]